MPDAASTTSKFEAWYEILKNRIELEYGEPEKPGEHCEAAADAIFQYMHDGLAITHVDGHHAVDMYELYLFARFLHGTGLPRGACSAIPTLPTNHEEAK